MILWVWEWIKTKVVTIVTIAGAGLIAYLSIRKAGKYEERADQLEQVLKNVRKKDEVTQKVDRLPAGSAADRLRDKWSRD